MPRPALVAESVLTNSNSLEYDYKSIDEAFPKVDPGVQPCGFMGLFQIRLPKRESAGGIYLVNSVRSTEHYNTQVAKCVALGPMAFKTVKEVGDGLTKPKSDEIVGWPEGPWCKVGDFVRLPLHGGDRFAVPFMNKITWNDQATGMRHTEDVPDEIIFALFRVKDINGIITGDPLKIKAYID